jgi:hypothetical protein
MYFNKTKSTQQQKQQKQQRQLQQRQQEQQQRSNNAATTQQQRSNNAATTQQQRLRGFTSTQSLGDSGRKDKPKRAPSNNNQRNSLPTRSRRRPLHPVLLAIHNCPKPCYVLDCSTANDAAVCPVRPTADRAIAQTQARSVVGGRFECRPVIVTNGNSQDSIAINVALHVRWADQKKIIKQSLLTTTTINKQRQQQRQQQ